ncbi:DUF3000 domain-containing protein [Cryptosporangium sp. NPDC048952]|uniref:DUF3000 domain-containing protein n=1 Tax=Cryptosporangium sp. NPDC048952 TaxID=3363961 RepID=UPI00372305C8
MAPTGAEPDPFASAVATLRAVRTRPEILLEEVPAPQRLAPRSFALSGTVVRGDEEVATGRLIVLHDPSGQEAWDGHWRVVSYVTAELESEMGTDPMLAAVGWSWLLDALDLAGARYAAIGGTVTQVSSTRFGDLAGPPTSSDVEVRASWTPMLDTSPDLAPHLDAWCVLLASTAGLPPPGVTVLAAHHSA